MPLQLLPWGIGTFPNPILHLLKEGARVKGIVKKSRCQFWLIFLGLFPFPWASFASNLDLTLIVQNPLPTLQQNKPITSGVPIPQLLGLIDLTALRLLNGSDQVTIDEMRVIINPFLGIN